MSAIKLLKNQERDGYKWAEEFCKATGFEDVQLAHAWFANAMMAMHDSVKKELNPYILEEERVALEEETAEDVFKEWKAEVESIENTEQAFKFVNKLINKYKHDYGTIINAIYYGMMATMRAMNESSQGGITGFQASCLGWKLVRKLFLVGEGPLSLVKANDYLYPQYADKFTTMDLDIWEWVQNKAKENLENKEIDAHPNVVAHWEKIVRGLVPFGLTLAEVDEKKEVVPCNCAEGCEVPAEDIALAVEEDCNQKETKGWPELPNEK